MPYSQGSLGAAAAAMIAQLDAQIGELEARGWLHAAAKAEELVCAIYEEAGVPVPEARLECLEPDLMIQSVRTESCG